MPQTIFARAKARLERGYVEAVPRHIRELAQANHVPTPNRYVPTAEAELIFYPEDAAGYEGIDDFYSFPSHDGEAPASGEASSLGRLTSLQQADRAD